VFGQAQVLAVVDRDLDDRRSLLVERFDREVAPLV
jgi:hypothetical protein